MKNQEKSYFREIQIGCKYVREVLKFVQAMCGGGFCSAEQQPFRVVGNPSRRQCLFEGWSLELSQGCQDHVKLEEAEDEDEADTV